jgi:hypothetical protein
MVVKVAEGRIGDIGSEKIQSNIEGDRGIREDIVF